MNQIFTIAGKELKTYFGTPMAAIFIGIFLLSSLFSFFWIESFFARNIANVRPLFSWMPILLCFLTAALTMRQWSEEEKSGTLEILLTLPLRIHHLILGKFLAALILVSIALLLTLGLPVTVSIIGPLDWGPVLGSYLGALLVAAAYISIGLFISSRTDNQIIALMLTVLLTGSLYLIGSSGITDIFANKGADLLRSLGSGSRFASIERGVVDLRDILYYLSLTLFFLSLNAFSLDKKRWSESPSTAGYRSRAVPALLFFGISLLVMNILLSKTNTARLDLTAQKEYSLSPATKDLLSTLSEPLSMKGFFSARTHPLLSPLVPQIKDMMQEYEIAAKGNISVSFVDPREDEEIEAETRRLYGISPVSFQVSGRYEAAVINSYFHILIQYGDKFVVLGFENLIEAKPGSDGQPVVSLRNLEYDLTKSIKNVAYSLQTMSTVFEQNPHISLFSVYTPDTLPEPFQPIPEFIRQAVQDINTEVGGKLIFEEIIPEDESSRQIVNRQFSIEPLLMSFFSQETFYLHLLLQSGDTTEQLYLTPDMSEVDIRQEIAGALKRNGAGFTKTIGFFRPGEDKVLEQMDMMHHGGGSNYTIFQQILGESYNIKETDLSTGRVENDVDVLLLVAPKDLTDTDRLAVDQYLMRSGAVVALAGNFLLDLSPQAESLQVTEIEDGLNDLLSHYGVTVGPSMVMDEQNEPFPIPVEREIGGIIIQEIDQIDYPFFVDVRPENMARDSDITANLPAVTMNWVSPLLLDNDKLNNNTVSVLLQSSDQSWLRTDTDINPDFDQFPDLGFASEPDIQQYALAVVVSGTFHSYFADRPDPRPAPPLPLIKKSPESSRLVVIGSADFINDAVISMSQGMGRDRFLNGLEFIQNIIDWSVADKDLLTIRSRGSHTKLLAPLTTREQAFWEWLNYGGSLLALILISFYGASRRRKEKPMTLINE